MQTDPSDVDSNLFAELRAGEQMLWWGRPNPKRRMRHKQSQMITVRFGIVLLSFLLILIIDATVIPDIPYILRSSAYLLLVMLLLTMIVSYAFFYTLQVYRVQLRLQKQLRYTFYAITDRRAFMMTALPGKSRAVVSYAREDIGTISREEGEGGWGDLTFGILRPATVGTRTMLTQSRFSGIPNVRQVEEIMFRTFKNTAEPLQPAPGERVSYEQ
jgi:hypothetical protein